MLTIIIPPRKMWNSEKEIFIDTKEYVITLEHSLVSISKWESKWHIPFISDTKKTHLQQLDYIKFMTLTQKVDDEAFNMLTKQNLKEISDYIDDKRTATWFGERKNKPPGPVKKEVITSELIYYWMIALEIPFECQKWHLNRLLTLVKVCNAKAKLANKGKKGNKKETLASNAEINAARRKALGTKG